MLTVRGSRMPSGVEGRCIRMDSTAKLWKAPSVKRQARPEDIAKPRQRSVRLGSGPVPGSVATGSKDRIWGMEMGAHLTAASLTLPPHRAG
jgi:hypothetical protein